MLLAAAAVSIVRQHRLHRPPFRPEEGRWASRDVCRHFDRVDRRCRQAEAFRLDLDARLTPRLQIDGYPTSMVPSRADRSAFSDLAWRRESRLPARCARGQQLRGITSSACTRSRISRDCRSTRGRKSKESIPDTRCRARWLAVNAPRWVSCAELVARRCPFPLITVLSFAFCN